MLLRYVPQAPKAEALDTVPMADGGESQNIRYRNVTETAEIMVLGSNALDAQARAESIVRLFEQARFRQSYQDMPRLYLYFSLDSDARTWRSEILYARVEAGEDLMRAMPQALVPLRIHWTRRFFWETTDLIELRLASHDSPLAATGGKIIHNHTSVTTTTSFGNWVTIAANQVQGVLPTPAKIQMTNTTGSPQNYVNFYIANNTLSYSNLHHVIEGENATSGSQVTDATCSSNAAMSFTFSGTTIPKWEISVAKLSQAAGRMMRILARFRQLPISDAFLTPILYSGIGSTELIRGEKILPPREVGGRYQLVDLGALPFPVGGYGTTYSAAVLGLLMSSTTSASVQIDFFQLFPSANFRHLRQRGQQIAANDSIVDDGIENQQYSVEGGVNNPIFSPRGDPILLWPGRAQRLYFLWDVGITSTIAQTFSVRIWHRPRRLTI
jgi:hypothetical protein